MEYIFSFYYKICYFYDFSEAVAHRFARRNRCGLATDFSPLAQNENSKKSAQLTGNLAMKFCAMLVAGLLSIISKSK